jgi:hypothetical protein
MGVRLNLVIFMINLISSLYLTAPNNWAKQRRVINETQILQAQCHNICKWN